ncbi:MAG: hypothetical protein PVI57_21290 [Gemmatimonadota bacterium]
MTRRPRPSSPLDSRLTRRDRRGAASRPVTALLLLLLTAPLVPLAPPAPLAAQEHLVRTFGQERGGPECVGVVYGGRIRDVQFRCGGSDGFVRAPIP